ncbi:MAG: ATP-binding cassette domain-containing protein [Actinomycetota bacterium]
MSATALLTRPPTDEPPPTTPIVEVNGVVVRFDALTAVNDVSLSINAGEVRGLLGPNGSGKTTLVNVIATLRRPTAGTVRVGGHDVVANPTGVRRTIGLAGQYAAVDDLLTGRENIEIIGRLYGLDRRSARRRADEVLERLSLTEAADRQVRTYSGGMRRRLDLGASLAGRPQVLLLDEPTTGLDPHTRLELWDFLRDLVAEGTTVLLTTQYLEEADALADRITVIDRGSVIAEGTADELKSSVGASRIRVVPTSGDQLPAAASAMKPILGEAVRIDGQAGAVTASVSGGMETLLATAAALHGAGVDVTDIAVERPSLDDVFLSITGNDADRAEIRAAPSNEVAS